MSKKIIITGGLGYIGTELCKIYSGTGAAWNRAKEIEAQRIRQEKEEERLQQQKINELEKNTLHELDLVQKEISDILSKNDNSVQWVYHTP